MTDSTTGDATNASEEELVADPDRTPYLRDVLADLGAARSAMNDNRPLEALAQINRSIDRLEDELQSRGGDSR